MMSVRGRGNTNLLCKQSYRIRCYLGRTDELLPWKLPPVFRAEITYSLTFLPVSSRHIFVSRAIPPCPPRGEPPLCAAPTGSFAPLCSWVDGSRAARASYDEERFTRSRWFVCLACDDNLLLWKALDLSRQDARVKIQLSAERRRLHQRSHWCEVAHERVCMEANPLTHDITRTETISQASNGLVNPPQGFSLVIDLMHGGWVMAQGFERA